MEDKYAALRQEYQEKRHLYETLCREAVRQLEELLARQRIALAFPVEHRVKSVESILEKCGRLGRDFKALRDMRDVAGIRLVLLFRQDAERVIQLISEHFQVLQLEDAQARLEADRFGYASVHLEVQPKEEWLSVPSWKPLAGLPAEIQVRTASQHIWAVASHLLQYKRESHVPVPVRRTINRVAALLELVDLELDRVLAERQGYREALAGAPPADAQLNIEVLRRIMDRELPKENQDSSDETSLAEVLDECDTFGVKTEKALEQLLRKHAQRIRDEEATVVRLIKVKGDESGYRIDPDRVARGIFYSHVGLVRQAFKEEFGPLFEAYLMKKAGTRHKS
jgi:ppGpp synthetase/RelA/SpoT-type nucleotidyltranferase